jgi:hypothetical protein
MAHSAQLVLRLSLTYVSHLVVGRRRPGLDRWVGCPIVPAGAHMVLAVLVWLAAVPAVSAVEIEAFVGQPYGVASLTIRPADHVSPLVARSDGFQLHDAKGLVRYPVVTTTYAREGGLLSRLLGVSTEVPRSVTVLFLFQGEAPFDVQWHDGTTQTIRVTPRPPRRLEHQRLVNRWWREFQTRAERFSTRGDQLLHEYLEWRIASQLPLPPRLQPRRPAAESDDQTVRTLQLVTGAESLRFEVRRSTLYDTSRRSEQGDQPIPAAVEWLAPPVDPAADVVLEPLASRVPAECFYIRFGAFSNYLWLNQLLTEFGGDLAGMASPQPLRQSANGRVQRQLGLKQSALAEVMGPAVIADVALIGHDLYLAEGAALGMLFQARNPLLGQDLVKQRRAAMSEMRDRGAAEETLSIGGRNVSLISTPDQRLRSYYVADGDYHLVTTSRRLVERFLEVRDGQGTLADLDEFHHARQLLPIERDDAVFVYFSTPFLQNLVSPHYQIERLRRLRAATDMELLALARIEAAGQGHDELDADELIRHRFLPANWARRPEPGEVRFQDGELVDTHRGARGSFLPISDVELAGATRAEVETYHARADEYRQNWRQFDPLMVAIQRSVLNRDGLERITLEAHLNPLNDSKYGKYLSILGPPTTHRIAPMPGDIVSLQAFVQGGKWAHSISPHLLFLGIQDAPPATSSTGFFKLVNTLRSTPGYLGAWPKLGFLDWLPVWIGGGEPDPAGYSRLPLGIWRRQWADLSVLSFQRHVLEQVSPRLDVEEAADPAQVRLYVGDLSQSQIQGMVSQLSGERTLEASLHWAGFLNRLTEQLRLTREEALWAAELLLDGELVCPFTQEPFELWETNEGRYLWVSPAWANSDPLEAYEAPVLWWFRGLNADLTRHSAGLLVRAELDMQRHVEESPRSIPFFDFFRSERPSSAPDRDDPPEEQRRRFELLPPPGPAPEKPADDTLPMPRRREF